MNHLSDMNNSIPEHQQEQGNLSGSAFIQSHLSQQHQHLQQSQPVFQLPQESQQRQQPQPSLQFLHLSQAQNQVNNSHDQYPGHTHSSYSSAVSTISKPQPNVQQAFQFGAGNSSGFQTNGIPQYMQVTAPAVAQQHHPVTQSAPIMRVVHGPGGGAAHAQQTVHHVHSQQQPQVLLQVPAQYISYPGSQPTAQVNFSASSQSLQNPYSQVHQIFSHPQGVPSQQIQVICNPNFASPTSNFLEVSGDLARSRKRSRRSQQVGYISSKYRGVSWHRRDRKWLARIWINAKIEHLGCFRSEEMAALAVDLRTIEHFGVWYRDLNFPDENVRKNLIKTFKASGEFKLRSMVPPPQARKLPAELDDTKTTQKDKLGDDDASQSEPVEREQGSPSSAHSDSTGDEISTKRSEKRQRSGEDSPRHIKRKVWRGDSSSRSSYDKVPEELEAHDFEPAGGTTTSTLSEKSSEERRGDKANS